MNFLTQLFHRYFDDIKNLPWQRYLLAVGSGFILATALSIIVTKMFLANQVLQLQKIQAVGESSIERERPSLMTTDVDSILQRNIFNIEDKYPDEDDDVKEKKPVSLTDEAVKSTLALKLAGTIYGGDPFSGIAIIQDTEKKTFNSFMVGDALLEGAKLAEIYKERVIIDRGTHREFLELDQPGIQTGRKTKKGLGKKVTDSKPKYASEPPPDNYKEEGFERSGAEVKVSKDFRSKLLTSDFTKVLQDAKAEPHIENGELVGFRLTRIRSESIYEKAGIRNEDVVREINGVSLTSAAQAIKLLNSLRDESEIEVRLSREGKPLTVNIQVR